MSGARPIDSGETRPVWMTRKQRDLCEIYGIGIYTAWDAAPPDATEIIVSAIGTILNERPYCQPEDVARAVLRALGAPHE